MIKIRNVEGHFYIRDWNIKQNGQTTTLLEVTTTLSYLKASIESFKTFQMDLQVYHHATKPWNLILMCIHTMQKKISNEMIDCENCQCFLHDISTKV